MHAFAERGDRVAVHCRDAVAAAEAVRESLPGSGHATVRADLADADAVRSMVDAAASALGGLDVLVNNAGIYLDHPMLGTSYEEWQAAWQATLGVNLAGAANVTWCAVRHMAASGRGGRIVNVGSRGAYRGEPTHPAYGASKAGLHAFGQSLAVALAPHGITVASVAPGFVQTDMAAGAARDPGRRRHPRPVALQPGRHARGDRGRGRLPGLPRGDLVKRRRPRPQRRLVPALNIGNRRRRAPSLGSPTARQNNP